MNNEIISDQAQSLPQIYAALGHAIRYDIINYLGSFHRPIHYTELVEWLKIKPGSFYFHMKKLESLVAQDDEKRFYLTPLGEVAFQFIRSGEKIHSGGVFSEGELIKEENLENNAPERFKTVFFGEFIRSSAFNMKFQFSMLTLVLIQIILLDISKVGTIPFYIDGDLYFGLIGCMVELLLSIIAIWVLLEIIVRKYSPIRKFSFDLLMGLPIALSPLFFYPLLIIIGDNIPVVSETLSSRFISIGIIFILQLITAVFLIQLLQVIKSVSFEKALIPVFVTLY
ncbi:MAG: winged helix-turn-helix domain-containing protein, partial [Candidatus Hodarchaeales archaeon]